MIKPDWLRSKAERRDEAIDRARELHLAGGGQLNPYRPGKVPLRRIAQLLGVAERTVKDYLKAGAKDPSWRHRKDGKGSARH